MSVASRPAAPRESDAILARLLDLHPKAIDLSLGRMTRLLDALGNPERTMPPVIHVAGTNGKGSVVAYLDATLRAAGYRVNSYVSPHLVRFAERIRLGGVPIAEDSLRASLAHCEAVNDGAPITFFEITTAAAFHAFERNPSDVLLLEVGLGGRLDATNVIARPALTVITPVSIDHTHYLGETLPLIAAEKAGILKRDVTGVIGRQEAEADAVIESVADGVGAPLARSGREWSFERSASHVVVRDVRGEGRYPLPGLAGDHQVENAALAAVCARLLPGFDVGDDAIAQGLRQARWPGRLQRIPWAGLADVWELWIDGGHNEAAAMALARVAESWADRPLDLVVGMLNTRPPEDYLRPLAPFVRRLAAVAIPDQSASRAAVEVDSVARSLGMNSETDTSVGAAVTRLSAGAANPGRILVCGSLYLVGSVLARAGVPAA
ncbi:MAG: bifunctional folylpolyglutamate synthase/dihydrofolate synthase [Rhodospirillaceae bacterium]|nr:bifunctional folylpolyglutamate synthase/dihydrofolate synthase [Rhodospirillaceae bacterium]